MTFFFVNNGGMSGKADLVDILLKFILDKSLRTRFGGLIYSTYIYESMGGKMVCFHLLSACLMFDHLILALFSFAKTNLPQLHYTINLMYSQIIDGLLPQNSKNHIFP